MLKDSNRLIEKKEKRIKKKKKENQRSLDVSLVEMYSFANEKYI